MREIFGALGLISGALLSVEAVAPYGGVYTVRVGAQVHVLGDPVIRALLVGAASSDEGNHLLSSPAPLGEHA